MTGQCLCGEIKFEAQEIPNVVFNCHCSRCRTSHGADYATQAFAVRNSLEFIRGADKLKEYDSTGGIRAFCSNCGSRLMNYGKDGADYLSVAIACLDENYEGKAVANCFTNDKDPWHAINEEIPSFEGFPDNI